ncbi:hypothetical protein Micbo1qcDRAFT_169690 [Microdochium bolleyi]|uniref:Uncharacterized protein n=1 Tax=Microdochium bolleyi TaxID=196109 RepID=A0A136IJ99_9PEZI|nr:hypothetical protein Micbo1qcDRAFT_169690 [Microdochium bolleyi]
MMLTSTTKLPLWRRRACTICTTEFEDGERYWLHLRSDPHNIMPHEEPHKSLHSCLLTLLKPRIIEALRLELRSTYKACFPDLFKHFSMATISPQSASEYPLSRLEPDLRNAMNNAILGRHAQIQLGVRYALHKAVDLAHGEGHLWLDITITEVMAANVSMMVDGVYIEEIEGKVKRILPVMVAWVLERHDRKVVRQCRGPSPHTSNEDEAVNKRENGIAANPMEEGVQSSESRT